MRIKTLARPAAAAALVAAVIAIPGAVGADDHVQPAVTTAESTAPPHGVWLDEQGRGAIEIAPCASGLCGRLVWTKEASRSARAACGMQIIGDVKRIDAATWNGGWIYSPELKSRFDVELKPIDGENLQVTGFAGSRDVSETMIWRRAPADLGRCSGGPERADYVGATVTGKRAKVAAVAGAAGAAAVATRAASKSTKVAADKPAAKASKAAAKPERKTQTRVAAASRERAHTSGCHVRAPFVSVSFRCSAKASRVLARLF